MLRSEEHTSELQSHSHLVCRLLLEKKKKIHITTSHLSMSVTTCVFFFFFLMIRRPPRSTLFPYTTLSDLSTRLNSSHTLISYAVFCLAIQISPAAHSVVLAPVSIGRAHVCTPVTLSSR